MFINIEKLHTKALTSNWTLQFCWTDRRVKLHSGSTQAELLCIQMATLCLSLTEYCCGAEAEASHSCCGLSFPLYWQINLCSWSENDCPTRSQAEHSFIMYSLSASPSLSPLALPHSVYLCRPLSLFFKSISYPAFCIFYWALFFHHLFPSIYLDAFPSLYILHPCIIIYYTFIQLFRY